jgi:hypothetical protein
MPSPTYAQNKKSIYNYRLKNLDKVREISRISMNRINAFKRQSLLFRMILIDELCN